MVKKVLITVSLFAILLMLALTYVTARFIDQEEILRAKSEAENMRNMRDSLLMEVAVRDSLENVLNAQIAILNLQADSLRTHVSQLELERKKSQLTVRHLRKNEDLLKKLEVTFPEMAESDWGVEEVYNEEYDVSIDYLLIPLWFSETFIIDHQNSESYKAQKDDLWTLDTLQTEVDALKDSLFVLEHENRTAYQDGFNEAFSKYQDINGRYINLLEKPPQVTLGLPKWGWLALAAAGGVTAGIVLE